MTILYFAWLRQKIGVGEETMIVPDEVKTVADLIQLLQRRGPHYREAFADLARVRVAVDQEHTDFDTPITTAAEVAFFPPVTGG
ncbi:MAG: molybdopterin converting factor subunit 1 [Alphaproteobacteria bacterium 62-8]|nr:MAG: molybdopterin converting factor subunit 1 [Alphaproteobacteria bacterium 62-8]